MKNILIILVCALSALSATASEIIRGTTLTDGQQLYASDLHGLIDNSTIGVQFFNDQQTTPSLNSGYYFLVLDPANQVYRRITAQTMLYGNTNIFLNVPVKPVPVYGSILFYDPTNGWIGSTTLSNLFGGLSGNINVAGLKFATTNNAGATNQYVLPLWPYGWSGFQTNQQPQFLTFDTNGILYSQSLSNLETSVASDLGTNLSIPFVNRQMFTPWTLYGTNTVPPYTNAWGLTTNFPITSLTNSANTNIITLSTNDTFPILSSLQTTNTTVSIGALVQYLTALNALPNYTQARISFGQPAVTSVYPTVDTINMCLSSASSNYLSTTLPICISFLTVSGGSLPVTSPALALNTPYWALKATGNVTNAFRVFASYNDAAANTNWFQVTGTGTKTNSFNYVPPFTSFNAEVIQLSTGTSPATEQAGQFAVYFMTPSTTTNYYVSGSCQNTTGGTTYSGIVNVDNSTNAISTNSVWIDTARGDSPNNFVNFPRTYLLVSPQ